ncbi:ribokinase [Allopusillimonas soli]|uniref:Ribokinase n=1 Tax=Allopusillimonas soli TaxID=659016 RepID=A0A853F9Y1_9BURK|nr:ribokinase [Allopusillimonas soli]NYT35401.1 ribokinase [Allopusillimonas soli]TEA75817.1 ribokinase [Allopusillimonas soli]
MTAARSSSRLFVAGIYAADLVFAAQRLPSLGETIQASGFMRSHGGKGSNQAVAAARAGADVCFFTLIGDDAFGEDARALWRNEGVRSLARVIPGQATGAAGIFVEESGDNAIVVYPGACRTMGACDLEMVEAEIAAAKVFVIQLEQPVEAALRGLELARRHGVITVLNPAPACPLPEALFPLCDYILPNESEASRLTGLPAETPTQAEAAARALLSKGVGSVVMTLGDRGSLFCNSETSFTVAAHKAGACVDTTGAGDGYTAGFATALAQGRSPRQAMLFATALAGISVTRRGAAASMPTRAEIETALAAMAQPPQ